MTNRILCRSAAAASVAQKGYSDPYSIVFIGLVDLLILDVLANLRLTQADCTDFVIGNSYDAEDTLILSQGYELQCIVIRGQCMIPFLSNTTA